MRKSKIGKKWYENIAITYTLTSLNRISVVDSIGGDDEIFALSVANDGFVEFLAFQES